MDFENYNSQYIIINSFNLEAIESILYSKGYQTMYLDKYNNIELGRALIAYQDIDNTTLKDDSLFILDKFNNTDILIKYKQNKTISKIFEDSSTKEQNLFYYNTDSKITSYIINGLSISFTDKKRHIIPNSAKDLEIGMLIEYENNDKWISCKIENPTEEWDKFYSLLHKYNRVRIAEVL